MTERRKIVLVEYREKKLDEAGLDVELPDSTTVTIPPPELWPDAAIKAIAENDIPAAVEAALGDDHEAFIAAGGTAALVMSMVGDVFGGNPGESKASSRS